MSLTILVTSLFGFACGILVFPLASMTLKLIKNRRTHSCKESASHYTTFVLNGSISQNSIATHCQTLSFLKKEGALHIVDGIHKGYILFRDGAIIDALYRENCKETAFFEILKLTTGDYYFESRTVIQPALIHRSVEELLELGNSK